MRAHARAHTHTHTHTHTCVCLLTTAPAAPANDGIHGEHQPRHDAAGTVHGTQHGGSLPAFKQIAASTVDVLVHAVSHLL